MKVNEGKKKIKKSVQQYTTEAKTMTCANSSTVSALRLLRPLAANQLKFLSMSMLHKKERFFIQGQSSPIKPDRVIFIPGVPATTRRSRRIRAGTALPLSQPARFFLSPSG
jgi:hypothetical protein